MAFRYFYQISCSANIPCGILNNASSNVCCTRLSSNLSKATIHQQRPQSTDKQTKNLTNPSNSIDQPKLNLLSNETSANKIQEFLDKDERQNDFLTTKKYYLQDSRRIEKPNQFSATEYRHSKEPNYLQPSKLQPFRCNSNFNVSYQSIPPFENKRKYSTSLNRLNFDNVLNFDAKSDCFIGQNRHNCTIKCTKAPQEPQKNLLGFADKPVKNCRQFSTKRDCDDCDCPPTASRNLTSVDSSYITYRQPCDVPPLPPKIKRCQPAEPPRKCPKVEERIPRADDCYEEKPKKLPPLPCKTCPVVSERLCEGKPLPKLRKRPVEEPLKCCITIPICECAVRADDCLKVKKKNLPKIKFSNCPKVESCIFDVAPLKPLKKLYECEPVKVPPEPESCNSCDRADTGAKFEKPTLSKVRFDFIPNVSCPEPPKIPLNRLPKLEGKDPPKFECEEIPEKCERSDDCAPKTQSNHLPTLILKPENNCVSTSHCKRIFTSVRRKYSILAAIKNPWALSVLTANFLAFNYYNKIKPDQALSVENSAFENEVKKNLSQTPTKTLKKRTSATLENKATTSVSKERSKRSKKTAKRTSKDQKSWIAHKKSTKSKIDDPPSDGAAQTLPKLILPFTNTFPNLTQWEKLQNYVKKLKQEEDFAKQFKHFASNNLCGTQEKSQPENYLYYPSPKRKAKISFLVYSVNNHRAIHSSTRHCTKSDKKKKCGNKNCVKIKWPGLPPRTVNTCEKEYKHKVCKKKKCPYPAFSECGSIGDFPICECPELPKLLQPRYKILPKLKLIKAAPPEWSLIDTDQEKKCVMEKLQMQPGETRTCDDFYCPPQHIGSEYLTEEEKECPPKKPKPPVSCVPCVSPEPIKTRKFEFKRYPPQEPVCSPPPKPCIPDPPCKPPPKPCPPPEPEKCTPTCPPAPECPSPCDPPASPCLCPTPPKNNIKSSSRNECDDPWSPPKKKCGPLGSQQMVRFASTSAQNHCDFENTKGKSLWEVVCKVFKTNLSKSCEEIKCICKKLHNEAKSKSEMVINSNKLQNDAPEIKLLTRNNNEMALSTQSEQENSIFYKHSVSCFSNSNFTIKNDKDWTNDKNKKIEEFSKVELINLLEPSNTNRSTISNEINSWNQSKISEAVANEASWSHFSTFNTTPIKRTCKKCNQKLKLGQRCPHCSKLKQSYNKIDKMSFNQINKKNKSPVNSSLCHLSTTTNPCRTRDDSWKQSAKSEPDLLVGKPCPKSAPNDTPASEEPACESSCGNKSCWPECKTPIMKVCCEHRHQTSCFKEYVHPRCEAQKAPFPSFSECHPPFPKFRLTECEVQRRNILYAKQKLQIYSVEKPKHKYCLRCGTKCNKHYSTLSNTLRSLGVICCKRYISTTRKSKQKLVHQKEKVQSPKTVTAHAGLDIMDGIKNEIKAVEANDKELDNNSYYKLLKVLESYPNKEVYNFFDGTCNNISTKNEKRKLADCVLKKYDEVEGDQLYKNFHNKVCYNVKMRKDERVVWNNNW